MKKVLGTILLSAFVFSLSSAALAQGSGTATGGMQCYINGKYVFVAHGGCPGGGGNTRFNQPSQPYYDPNAAAAAAAAAEAERQRQIEADRQRQREAEEQRLRDEEAAKQRQAEFERKKQEALDDMKGIAEGEFGLKDDGAVVGLKDLGDTGGLKDAPSSSPAPGTPAVRRPDCKWGDQDSSAVDLRCLGLNLDKPIVIDPHIARGHERVFSAQIDPAIFEDVNYKKAMEAEMHFDLDSSAAAVQYFKQALLSHPNDPLVRNALLLAQDILAERTQRQQQADEQSELAVLHSLVDLMNGDLDAANQHVKHAGEIAPANEDIRDLALSLGVMSSNFKNVSVPTRDLKTVEKLVGNAYLAEGWGHYRAEIKFMEKAKQLDKNDAYVAAMLARARYLSSKYPDIDSNTLAPK
jgi:tetratricopeptide (TPR) repeat protein